MIAVANRREARRSPHRAGRWAALALVVGLGLSPLANAEGPALRADMIASLESMQQALQDSDLERVTTRAKASAERLAGGNAADRWARALFLQLAATAEARQQAPGSAADLLATARSIDQVPASRRLAWLEQEAKLRLRAGQTKAGADLLTRWVERSGGDDASRWLLIQARASLGDWSAAANSLARIRESGDTDSWTSAQRQLAEAVYQQAGQFGQALSLIDTDTERDAGRGDLWRRMAGMAQRAGDVGRAAAIWESGWRRGALTAPEDLEQLAKLHLAGGTPARAGEHLSDWLENGQLDDSVGHRRLLAQAWTAARERDRALAAWRQLAQRTQAPDDWHQLADIAYGWGEWQTTLEALNAMRDAGGDFADRDWLLYGIAAAQLERTDDARDAFRQAQAIGVEQAQQWLDSLGSA
ncbi:hypothetical protein [Salinicola aestuarinus]|uniref:hypothetical protein n=1 Tax=Salinicola aestuarinus TaxID=1949082 RepID=UPI000DA24EEA|nr:hypothetical protein [Salinicola aestuarinus]